MTFDPGRMRERVAFQSRGPVQDDYGNATTGEFVDRFVRSALYLMRQGSETVLAARLQGVQPVTIVVRRDSETRTITSDWRARDVHTGTVYAIRAAEDMDRSRAWISIVAEAGVAP